ncbi:MAG: hypothetical protein K5762_03205 [Bacilli bacterium]|nr:hypothetical protein [Bacilli bacterium]
MEEYLTKTEIRYSQVNSGLHVTLLALAQIIEDATTKFLEQHHLSGGFLNKKYGAILVVLRNHIYFHDRCHLGDNLLSKVEVIRKSSVAFFLRTRLYRENEKEPLITSYIQISAIDMKERTLRPLSQFEEFNMLNIDEELPTHGLFEKYGHYKDDTTIFYHCKVESTDIDYSNHLNNIAYIKYFMNCLNSDELRHLRFQELEINYIKEARENEPLLIEYTKKENTMYFTTKIDDTVITKAKLVL